VFGRGGYWRGRPQKPFCQPPTENVPYGYFYSRKTSEEIDSLQKKAEKV
jgi:hypothetical protein